MSPKWAWSGSCEKNFNFTPLLISGTVNGRPLKFCTQLRRDKYNTYIYRNLWIVEWSNFALCLLVLQTHVTWDHFGLYSLTGSNSIYAHVYFNCSMTHWTDSVFARTLSCFTVKLTCYTISDINELLVKIFASGHFRVVKLRSRFASYMLMWVGDTGTYALSVLDIVDNALNVKHYHIKNLDDGGFYVSYKNSFKSLEEMVHFYSGKCAIDLWWRIFTLDYHATDRVDSLSPILQPGTRYQQLIKTCQYHQ